MSSTFVIVLVGSVSLALLAVVVTAVLVLKRRRRARRSEGREIVIRVEPL